MTKLDELPPALAGGFFYVLKKWLSPKSKVLF